MAAPTVLHQMHGPGHPHPPRPRLSSLGAALRTRLLLAWVDSAGDRAADPPARVLQPRPGLSALQRHRATARP